MNAKNFFFTMFVFLFFGTAFSQYGAIQLHPGYNWVVAPVDIHTYYTNAAYSGGVVDSALTPSGVRVQKLNKGYLYLIMSNGFCTMDTAPIVPGWWPRANQDEVRERFFANFGLPGPMFGNIPEKILAQNENGSLKPFVFLPDSLYEKRGNSFYFKELPFGVNPGDYLSVQNPTQVIWAPVQASEMGSGYDCFYSLEVELKGEIFIYNTGVNMYHTTNVEREGFAPKSFTLEQNYPNPFNPTTTISYNLPHDVEVKLAIFDITGREVATLVNGFQNAGSYQLKWNATHLPSGVYFYRLRAGSFQHMRRMVLVK